jgi:hypothetical protein
MTFYHWPEVKQHAADIILTPTLDIRPCNGNHDRLPCGVCGAIV